MGTGQMLTTVFAIILLGTVILNTNRGITNSGQILRETSYWIEDVSYAASMIQKANQTYFDDNCKSDTELVTVPTTGFTAPASLGYEGNDPTDLDDIDDFNGKPGAAYPNNCRLDSSLLSTGWYYARTQVHYVSLKNLDSNVSVQTFHKRLDVWVWNKNEFDTLTNKPKANDTLHMATVVSYWAF